MKVTTVRLRPLRGKTIDEAGIDKGNVLGPAVEFWIGGELEAVLHWFDEEAQIIWGTAYADEYEREIRQLANTAFELMEGRLGDRVSADE